MKRIIFLKSAVVAAAAIAVVGCGGGKKVAATVNGDSILEDEFYERALKVNVADLSASYQAGGSIRVGEYALDTLIREKLVLQMAGEKNVLPKDSEITAYIPFAKKYQQNPQITYLNLNPFRTEDEWRRDVKVGLCIRNLALAPLKIADDEVKKEYETMKARVLTPADQFHIRLIDITDKARADAALDKLKKNVPFETVALNDSEDKASRAKSGDVGWIPQTAMPPALFAAVKELKPGSYTPEVIKVSASDMGNTQPGAPPVPTHYFIAKLEEIKKGAASSLEESRPLVERFLMDRKDPNAMQRVQDDLRQYKEKAKIDIKLKGFEKLLDKKAAGAQNPAGAGAPGAPAGAGAPGAPTGAPGQSAGK